ncbi:DNA-binding TFAR19-related protein [Martensiomyces pterosporus]|nr:DNA-binding TFAR19-related protein [Martensiomyces pterosporus]
MADSDLDAIRARRLAEMQAQGGSGPSNGSEANAQKSQQEEARQNMLAQVLSREARERLGRIAMVKPEKARAVEDMLLRMARMGQIRNKVSEDELKEMLEQINAEHHTETKIIYNRKGFDDSDDEDEYDL